MSARIVIVDYDPQWPDLFKSEADRIRAALGSLALRVEHTGSTSVPGLAAKPVIDIVLAVDDSGSERDYLPALQAAGYALLLREPAWHEHRLLNRLGAAVNLHVFSAQCPEIERMLVFRDWLRTHPEDRELYSRTKRALAEQEWKTVDDYAGAKTAVISQILCRARFAD